ncbi:MAG: hypothetical protein ACO3UX_12590, partial [Candidatus Nanopelagicales bacterium]
MYTLTAGDAEVLARRAAASLMRLGLGVGDRVAIILPQPGDHLDERARLEAARVQRDVLACVYGALRRGVVPVMVNPALTTAERDVLIGDALPALVVDEADMLQRMLSGEDGEVDLADVPLARPMHFTSGTTGRSKGVWTGILDESDAR